MVGAPGQSPNIDQVKRKEIWESVGKKITIRGLCGVVVNFQQDGMRARTTSAGREFFVCNLLKRSRKSEAQRAPMAI
jgi:hypothetical protein